MGSSHRRARIDTLQRRRNHIEARLRDVPDGAGMYDRAELGALRYAVAMIEAARECELIDELEAFALRERSIPLRDASAEARRMAGVAERPRER